jgi:DNA-binding CsgD family transcriptional regulator
MVTSEVGEVAPCAATHPLRTRGPTWSFPLLARIASRGWRPSYTPNVLVGRATEQRRIGQVLDTARSGRAAVLALVGEPGSGKSALLDEAAAAPHGMTVLRARGVPSETHVPFGGLFALLRPVLGRLGSLPTPQARALESALALRVGRPQDRFAVGAATLGLLSAVAEQEPLLVLVDDLQSLDEASGAAMLFAARRLLADAVAVVVAARADEPSLLDGADLPRVELRGLDRFAAGELVRAVAAGPVDDHVLDRLHRQTGGNPLALLELAAEPRALRADGPADVPLPVVPTVAEVYLRRCGGLPARTRLVLLLAAAGEGSGLHALAASAQALGCALTDLAPAESVGLVRLTGEAVDFTHPLARSAVYGDAPPADRRRVHAALAGVLPDADADRRAWHLALAAVGPDDAACSALAQAADRAQARSAYDVAARAYARAAVAATAAPHRAELQLAGAEAAWLAGRPERALALLDAARDGSDAPELVVAAENLRGHIATRCGPIPAGRTILLAAAERIVQVDPDRAVVMLAEALNAAFSEGNSDAMRDIAARLAETSAAASTPRAAFFATMAQGMALLFHGNGPGGAVLVRQAVDSVDPASELAADPRLLAWLVMGPLWLRESAGHARVDVALEAHRRAMAIGTLPFLLSHVALGRVASDRWPEAEAGFSEAIGLARETGQRTDLAFALARLAGLEARQGKAEQCRAHATEALALTGALQLGPGEVWTHAALIDLELGEGRPEAALRHAAQQREVLARLGIGDVDLDPGPEIVDALLRLRRVGAAAAEAEQFDAAARDKGRPWALARAARCRGLLAPDGELDAVFAEALGLHDSTGDAFETARTQLAFGSRLRRFGHRVRAREQLRLAVATFDALGAAPWADLGRDELAATGETARRREPDTRDDLTPQELHLALMLAEGRTTRDVAAAVFLSPKTVEYHLRSVYRKLLVNTREQLALALRRLED